MEKLTREDGASPDVVADNIATLQELFPEVFADGSIDFETLKETLGEYVDDRDERYSFTWHGKSRARQISQMPSMGTLRPCPEESVNWDTTKNIFIEGDNLEVLKLLQKSYHRKIKMIYIDPPYNTGNEFIYPDKWQDNLDTYLRYTGQVDDQGFKLSANSETGGRYHTNWLNMMYPRLKLARNLLGDDGVIFVSIDDHEVQNLRHLMDEVFGAENFVASVVWQKRTSPDARRALSAGHDYVVCYGRALDSGGPVINKLPLSDERKAAYTNPDEDPRGPWASVDLTGQSGHATPSQFYTIVTPAGNGYRPPEGRCWALAEETFVSLHADARIWFGADGTSRPRLKKFLSESDGMMAWTWWPHQEVGHSQEATRELSQLMGGPVVDMNPKPLRLLERILRLGTSSEGSPIVLDFFAGSGTTGHAVMRLNAEDGGSRRFLLVQLPETTDGTDYETIAKITAERLRRASGALGSGQEPQSPIPQDVGFRVFELSSSNIKTWDGNFDSMDQDLLESIDNIREDRSEVDVLYVLLLRYGLDLAIPSETRNIEGCTVTVIGAGALIVCLSDEITLDAVNGIAALKDELKPEIMRVVFNDSGFADDVVKTNASQILQQAGIDDVKSL